MRILWGLLSLFLLLPSVTALAEEWVPLETFKNGRYFENPIIKLAEGVYSQNGKAVIQEKNVCEKSLHLTDGRTIYLYSNRPQNYLAYAKIENGVLMVEVTLDEDNFNNYPADADITLSGESLAEHTPPADIGYTATISGDPGPMIFLSIQRCRYKIFEYGEWQIIPSYPPRAYIAGIDLLNLKIEDITFKDAKQTDDKKFSVAPSDRDTIAFVTLSAQGVQSAANLSAQILLEVLDSKKTVKASKQVDVGTLIDGQNPPIEVPIHIGAELAGSAQVRATLVMDSQDINSTDDELTKDFYVLCDVETIKRAVPFWSQVEVEWGADTFGIKDLSQYNDPKMAKFGCSTTSATMMAAFYGVRSTPLGSPTMPKSLGIDNLPEGLRGEPLNPGTANHALASYRSNLVGLRSSGYNNQNNLDWIGAAEVFRAGYQAQCNAGICDPSKKATVMTLGREKGKGFNEENDSTDNKFVYGELCKGNPIILKFKKANSENGIHFMVAKAMEVNKDGKIIYILNNPGILGGEKLRQDNNNLKTKYPHILGYIQYQSSVDPSMMSIFTPVGVDFVVTDPYGRRSGYDPLTDTHYDEIEGGSYSVQSINTPAGDEFEDETLVAEKYFSYVTGLPDQGIPDGNYSVQVFSPEGGNYYIEYRGYGRDGNLNAFEHDEGVLAAGEAKIFTFKQSDEPLDERVFKEFHTDKYSIEHRFPRSKTHITLQGQILDLDQPLENFKNQFVLKIGGESGPVMTVPASRFKIKYAHVKDHRHGWHKKHHKKGKKTYTYNSRNANITIGEDGKVDIFLRDWDVSAMDESELSQFSIQVDDIIAADEVDLKCHRHSCEMTKRKKKNHKWGGMSLFKKLFQLFYYRYSR